MSVYSASDELDEEMGADLQGAQEPVTVEDSIPSVPLLKPETVTSSHSSSTEYATCASEISGSLRAQEGVESGSHTYLSAEASDPRERSGVSLASTVVTVTSEHAQTAPRDENGSTGQMPSSRPPALDVSGRVEATPQTTPPHTDSLGQSIKFNNLLDKCDATDSDTVKPKPRVFQPAVPWSENPPPLLPPGGPLANHQPQTMENSSQLSTVSTTAATVSPTTVNSPDKLESLHEQTSSPEASPSPLDGMNEDLRTLQPFLFPVSNSPVDLITMLSRLASFTGGLLTVLTPKIRKTGFTRNNKVRRDIAMLVVH